MLVKLAFIGTALAAAAATKAAGVAATKALAGLTAKGVGIAAAKGAGKIAMEASMGGLASSGLGSLVLDSAFSGNMQDVGHLLTSKSNSFGRVAQKLILSDAIVAAKKGSEGLVYANRRALPTALYIAQPIKALALQEANAATRKVPKIISKIVFDGNKLNTGKLKAGLKAATALDNAAFSAQISLPTVAAAKEYNQERATGRSVKDSLKAGVKAGLANAAVTSTLLAIPRKLFLQPAAELHRHLSKDFEYGYQLVEDSAKSAEKALNRPKLLNYTHYFYSTPEKNLNGISKTPANLLKRMMGQGTIKRYDKDAGYIYTNEKDPNELKLPSKTTYKMKQAWKRLNSLLAGKL